MSAKSNCAKCNKLFANATLKKRNGICGRCFNATVGVTKKNIPDILRVEVWKKYIGDTISGSCYVCRKEISFAKFQAGHIKSEYDNGKITVNNLRPVCKSCNVKTGVFNMDEIKDALKPTEPVVMRRCNTCLNTIPETQCQKSTHTTDRNYGVFKRRAFGFTNMVTETKWKCFNCIEKKTRPVSKCIRCGGKAVEGSLGCVMYASTGGQCFQI